MRVAHSGKLMLLVYSDTVGIEESIVIKDHSVRRDFDNLRPDASAANLGVARKEKYGN